MLVSLASQAGWGQGWAEGSHAGAGGDLLLLDMDNGLVTFINSEVPLLYPQLINSCHQGIAQTINISPFSVHQVALVSH